MGLEKVQATYEQLGSEDPLWAILTDDRFRGNKWDPAAFFATGREEIAQVLRDLAAQGHKVGGGTALDFGCGVGRLTQALCVHFQQVIGIDISTTMIDGAIKWNQHGERCRYLVNTTATIDAVADGTVDFVYSNITLQHSPPRYQVGYIAEFLRMLRPGGLAVFQVRIGPYRAPGSIADAWYRLKSETLRPLWKRMRGRPPVQSHTISERDVQEAVARAGGRVLAAVNTDKVPRRSRRSLRYTIQKP